MTVIEQPCETTVVPVTRREVLHRAADILGEWDWCQGAGQRGESFCALGAIWFAATGDQPACITFDEADERPLYIAAREEFSRVGGNATWNDAPGRTKAEVVARLRQAAENA